MTQSYRPGLTDYALLLSLAGIFGASFMMTKIAVAEVPPATIVFARLAIAAVLVGIAMAMVGQNIKVMLSHWRVVSLAALTGNALPFFLISWGQEKVDAGLTAILMAVMPLITLVLAHFFTADEKLNMFKIIGFCLGLAGVAVLIGFDKLTSLGSEIVRQYAIIAAACCYAVHAVISRRLTSLPRRAVATAVLLVSALMMLPLSVIIDQPWNLSVSSDAWLAILALGVLPTAVGTLMLFVIVQRQGAAFLSQINFLVPLFGVLWAIVFLGEILPPNAALALLIILAGVAISRIKTNKLSLEKAS